MCYVRARTHDVLGFCRKRSKFKCGWLLSMCICYTMLACARMCLHVFKCIHLFVIVIYVNTLLIYANAEKSEKKALVFCLNVPFMLSISAISFIGLTQRFVFRYFNRSNIWLLSLLLFWWFLLLYVWNFIFGDDISGCAPFICVCAYLPFTYCLPFPYHLSLSLFVPFASYVLYRYIVSLFFLSWKKRGEKENETYSIMSLPYCRICAAHKICEQMKHTHWYEVL